VSNDRKFQKLAGWCAIASMPLAIVLWTWLKPRNPNLVTMFILFGIGCMLVGAIGAAIFAAVLPVLTDAYAQASGAGKEIQEALYVAFSEAVIGVLWGTLGALLGVVWWLGIGSFLKAERRTLGWVTIVLGAIVVASCIGIITGLMGLANIAVPLYLLIGPIWALWLGIVLLRAPVAVEG